jgi:serine/threonine protein kinase
MATAVPPVDERLNPRSIWDTFPAGWEYPTVPSLSEYRWGLPDRDEQTQFQGAHDGAHGPVGPVAADAHTSPREVPSPTRRTAEGPLVPEQPAPAGVKGWPVLPGCEVLGEIGRGGMAIVYKARHLRLRCVVAIKMSARGLPGEGEIVARFQQEQLLAGRLTHPNLVAVYHAGQVAGFPYLVMEFVEGHDLAWLVQHYGPLPVAGACEVVRQAALGLQHIHGQGLVHRDVKPANVMLTPSGRVKVLDLGLVRDLHQPGEGERITMPGQFVGTLDYMAPEQCLDSRAVDGRADVYALGCTLYELLAGQPPFAGPAFGSVFLKMRAHVEAPVPPIRERRPDVPERLAAALERMLAKDRTDRFASPAGVVAALQPFAAGAELAGLSPASPPSAFAA